MTDDTDRDDGLPEPPPDDGPGLFGGPPAASAQRLASALPSNSAPPVIAAAPAKPYRVLARAYRPTRFEDLIGQDAMVRILRRAFAINRVAHAFMLTGVRGVGKTTSARIIARALNCIGPDGTGGPTAEPCGVCANCTAILADRHPDVLEMDAASRTGIDDVREIIEATRFRPMQARMKVFIVDEVHMLSKPAFNALLKTLEEPPSQVTFIFATTELRKVPVTVLSRCQRFDLRRVSIGELSEHFARIAAKEGAAIGADALALISRAADGSVRDGLSLLDQAIAQGPSGGGTEIRAEQVADMLGLADRGLVFDLLDAVMSGHADVALGITDQAHARGADLGQMLQDLLELIHTVSRLKSIPALRTSNELPEAERVRGAALADALSVPVLGRAWQMLLKGVAEIETAPDRREAAEMVLIRLCHVADLPTPGDLVRQIQAEGPGALVAPVAVMSPIPSGTSAPTSRSIDAGQGTPPSSTAAPAPGPAAPSSPPDADAGQGASPSPATAPAPSSAAPSSPPDAGAGQVASPSSTTAPAPGSAAPSSATDADAGQGTSPSPATASAPQPAAPSSATDAGKNTPSSFAAAPIASLAMTSSPADADARQTAPTSLAASPTVAPAATASPVAHADAHAQQVPPSFSAAPAMAVLASARSYPVAGQGAPPSPIATVADPAVPFTAAAHPEAHAGLTAPMPFAAAPVLAPVAGATPSPARLDPAGRSVHAAVQRAPSGAEAAPSHTASPDRDPQQPSASALGVGAAPAATTTSPSPDALPPITMLAESTLPASTPPVDVLSVAASSAAAPPSADSPVQTLSGGRVLRAPDPATAASVTANRTPVISTPAISTPAISTPAISTLADPSPEPPSLRSWREVVAFVNASRMARLHGNLMHCAHLVRFRPPVIELALESGAPKELSQQLAAVLREATGTRWSIVVVRDEPGEPTLAQQAGLVQADLDRDAESHPLVQAILAAFPGAVVGPVSDRSLDEYYALPPEQDGSLLAEDMASDSPPDMEFAPDNAESVGLDDLAAASGR